MYISLLILLRVVVVENICIYWVWSCYEIIIIIITWWPNKNKETPRKPVVCTKLYAKLCC